MGVVVLHAAGWSLAFGFGIGAVVMVALRLWGVAAPLWPVVAGGIAVFSLGFAWVWAARKFWDLPRAARELDRVAKSDDALSSALAIGGGAGPVAELIGKYAEEQSERMRARRAVVAASPFVGWWRPVVGAVLAVAGFAGVGLWMPMRTSERAVVMNAEEAAAAKADVAAVKNALVPDAATPEPSANVERVREEIEQLEAELAGGTRSPDAARAKAAETLTLAAERAEEAAEANEDSERALRDALAKAAKRAASARPMRSGAGAPGAGNEPGVDAEAMDGGASEAMPVDELLSAMEEGDWARAAEAAERLRNETPNMSEAERAESAERLKEFAEQLEEAAAAAEEMAEVGDKPEAGKGEEKQAGEAAEGEAKPEDARAGASEAERNEADSGKENADTSETEKPASGKENAGKAESGKAESGKEESGKTNGAQQESKGSSGEKSEGSAESEKKAGEQKQGESQKESGKESGSSAKPAPGEQFRDMASEVRRAAEGLEEKQKAEEGAGQKPQPAAGEQGGQKPDAKQGDAERKAEGERKGEEGEKQPAAGAESAKSDSPAGEKPEPSPAPDGAQPAQPRDGQPKAEQGPQGSPQPNPQGAPQSSPVPQGQQQPQPQPGETQPATGEQGQRSENAKPKNDSSSAPAGQPKPAPGGDKPQPGDAAEPKEGGTQPGGKQAEAPQKSPGGTPENQPGGAQGQRTPGENAQRMKGLAEQIDRIRRQNASGKADRQESENLRKRAEQLMRGMSPEDRAELEREAREWARENKMPEDANEGDGAGANEKPEGEGEQGSRGEQPKGDAGSPRDGEGSSSEGEKPEDGADSEGGESPPEETPSERSGRSGNPVGKPVGNSGPRAAPTSRERSPIGEATGDVVRPPSSDIDPSASGQTLAEWLAEPGKGGVSRSGSAAGSAADVKSGAARAIEERRVPKGYDALVRRVFGRIGDRLPAEKAGASESLAPAAAPAKPANAAKPSATPAKPGPERTTPR